MPEKAFSVCIKDSVFIDPPYNTGHDFVYHDDYRDNMQNYLEMTGQVDGEGKKISTNSEASGRYHTDWLNMMYPRLRLARNLLSDDGVIFISIDDNEVTNLIKICNEIFGETNQVAEIPWQSRASVQNDTDFSVNHEYILVYAKKRRQENRRLKESNYNEWHKKDSFVCKPLPLDKDNFSNPDNDSRGLWKADPFDAPNIRENLTYSITNPNTGEQHLPPHGRHWRMSEDKYLQALNEDRIVWTNNGKGRPQLKVFYEEKKEFGSVDSSWFSAEKIGTSTNGTKELIKLFRGQSYFDTPKPTSLLKKLITLANTDGQSIILDFFSGSATTAHAVMQLNAEDGGNRKFICVQLPEPTDEKSEAYKAGYKNICEIGKERIRRAGEQIEQKNESFKQITLLENDKDVELFLDIAKHGREAVERTNDAFKHVDESRDIDTGFKVFKLDTSNIKKWQPQPDADMQDIESTIDSMVDNLVEGRSELDFVYEIMLKYGIDLTYPIEEISCGGIKLYSIGYGMLMICMAENVATDIAGEIIKYKKENEIEEMRVVFKDSSFKDDSTKTSIKAALRDGGIAEFVTI